MESERRGLERCGASLSLSERGSGRVSDRVLRIREAGRDFTGVRWSSERGKEGGGREGGDAGVTPVKIRFTRLTRANTRVLRGNRVRGSRKTMR